MRTYFWSKTFLGVGGLSGVSTAIGVPVAFSIHKTESQKNDSSYKVGIDSPVLGNLKNCNYLSRAEGTEVEFGDNGKSKTCWKVEDITMELRSPEEYAVFFDNQGSEKEKNGNLNGNQGNGTGKCLNQTGSTPGEIINSSNTNEGIQYLGLCKQNDEKKPLFIKKRKGPSAAENRDKGTFLICEVNCGKNNPGTDGGKVLFTEDKKESGSEVKFYKKKD